MPPLSFQVGVKLFLENSEHKFLLLQRSPEKYPEVGEQWDIPGGRIDPGTPLLENLKREVREETALELGGAPMLIAAQDILKPDKHVVRLTYRGEANGTPKLSEEHSKFAWFSPEEMKQMEHLDKYVREILDGGIIK